MLTRISAARLRGRFAVVLIAAFAWLPFGASAQQCPPQANIQSSAQTVDEGVVVKLNGQPSKPNDATFFWERVSGPAPITFLPGPTDSKPDFVAPQVDATSQLVVRLTVRGCNGQANSSTITITIRDTNGPPPNTPPTVIASATPPIAGEGAVVALDGSATDAQGGTLTYAWTQTSGPTVAITNANQANASFTAPNVPAAGVTLQFLLTVTDPGGLSGTATVPVSIVFANDSPFAALSCPLEVDEGDLVTLDGSASSDYEDDLANIGLHYTWSQLEGPPNVDVASQTGDQATFVAPTLGTGDLGGLVFELKVADSQGVYTKATCGIFIRDVTAPVFANAGDRIEEATSPDGADVDYALTATDNVEGDVTGDIVCVPPSGSAFALGVPTEVQCEVADANGNDAHATFDVLVLDRTKPVIDPHEDVAVEAVGPTGANVDYQAPATFDVVDVDLVATCSPASGSLFALGSHAVACNATDASGNAAAPTQFVVTVHDTQPPVVSVPADIIAEATSAAGAAVSFTVSANDIVDLAVTPTCDADSGDTFPLGETTVHCSATDAHGNTGTASFKVTVEDTTPPVVTVPADITREASGPDGATATFAASASDIVSGNVPTNCLPASGSTFALGTTSVTCSATDAAGNTGHASFHVNVVDTTAPDVTVPADFSREATGPNGATATFATSASDLVSGAVATTCVPASGSMFALGTTTVTCSATDAHGNTGMASFHIAVVDTTPPFIAPHADVTANSSGNSSAVVTYTNPIATDLVDGVVPVTCVPASGTSFNVAIGGTTVNCSAEDTRHNASSSHFQVFVTYVFGGFRSPIDNLPTVNVVKAGQSIPVKFSLGGNQGMGIFATGYPKSTVMTCGAAAQDAVEETVTAGSSTLTYDIGSGQYHYVWKTDKAWGGSCRQLQIKFADGTTQVANFNFTR
jgi:hypothetical protein